MDYSALLEAGASFIPFFAAIVLTGMVMVLTRRVLQKRSIFPTGRWQRQAATALVAMTGIVLVILTLPLPNEDMRSQLIGLLGVALTGIVAISSTTFVTNAMAGLMLRIMRNFRPGDWISVGDSFGRVTELGLLHTEIQSEDRDLTTIPNLLMVTQPVKVVRSSGTIVSVSLSLGYDLPRPQIKALLIEAVTKSGLSEPFVQVIELGDYSITYRAAGFLEDVSTLIGSRSQLRAAILDALHGAGMEIVSPAFMNQRQITGDVIPPVTVHRDVVPHEAPEELAFDKATRASQATLVEEMIAERQAAADEARKNKKENGTQDEVDRLSTEVAALTELLRNMSETEAGSSDR